MDKMATDKSFVAAQKISLKSNTNCLGILPLLIVILICFENYNTLGKTIIYQR